VNVPAPERYAVHKLIIHGERPVSERTKSRKDLLQAASLVEYFAWSGQQRTFNSAWKDAIERGAGWKKRAIEGKNALLTMAPELSDAKLWR
jgi:hypothetical protein